MMTEKYTSKTGATRYRPVLTPEEADDIMVRDGPDGFCLGCGNEVYGVEPDARKYVCEGCGGATVYGMEELVIMCILKIKE